MAYAPVNNIIVLKGNVNYVHAAMNDREVKDKFNEVTDDTVNVGNANTNEAWIYYETNSEPHEEVPEFIKERYPMLRVFFSSIDYDEWMFAYYKEIGKEGEYSYGTHDEDYIEQIFAEFVEME